MEYAEFLATKHRKRVEQIATERRDIVRPEEEAVVASIKRLRQTYPMLDAEKLLHKASSFVMQHMVHGRSAKDTIDDLEVYFRTEYEVFIRNNSSNVSGT